MRNYRRWLQYENPSVFQLLFLTLQSDAGDTSKKTDSSGDDSLACWILQVQICKQPNEIVKMVAEGIYRGCRKLLHKPSGL